MEVYIEYAIIDNLVMDFLLLFWTAKLTKTKCQYFLLTIGAIVGTVIALIIPVFNLAKGTAFLVKVVLALLVCLVSAKHKTVFNYFKFVNCFLLLTFALGGAIIGILHLLNVEYSTQGIKRAGILPVGVNLLVLFACFLFVKKLTYSVIGRLNGNFHCEVVVSAHGEQIPLKGFIDSGNMLTDVKSGLPVVVCSSETFGKIFDKNFQPLRFMPINTATGIGMIALYNLDGIMIRTDKKTTYCDAVLGVSDNIGKETADIIIGANLL